jgi:hypothetical protein
MPGDTDQQHPRTQPIWSSVTYCSIRINYKFGYRDSVHYVLQCSLSYIILLKIIFNESVIYTSPKPLSYSQSMNVLSFDGFIVSLFIDALQLHELYSTEWCDECELITHIWRSFSCLLWGITKGFWGTWKPHKMWIGTVYLVPHATPRSPHNMSFVLSTEIIMSSHKKLEDVMEEKVKNGETWPIWNLHLTEGNDYGHPTFQPGFAAETFRWKVKWQSWYAVRIMQVSV